MPTRVTGMNSGLDTESLISELVKAKSYKVDNIKKDKTRLEWKQEAWKDLNKDLKSLQSKFSSLRYSSAYKKKTSSASNSAAVNVITGEGAMNSVQSLSIKKLAKTGYLTGQKVTSEDGSTVSKSTKISELALKDANGNKISGLADVVGGSFTVTVGGKEKRIEIKEDTTISGLVSQLNSAGVTANFDEKNGRLFIGAVASGKENDFSITADNAGGFAAMSLLGINVDPSASSNSASADKYARLKGYYDVLNGQDKANAISAITSDTDSEIYKMLKAEVTDESDPDFDAAYDKLMEKLQYASTISGSSNSAFYSTGAVKLSGEDAEIELNGATFTSSSNNIEVNGLTFECKAIADDITITTEDDTQGVYDMVKDILKQYNEVINKLDKLYNAESSKGYEPLTDDEKDAMSEKEIEKWEGKIKDAILRKDSTLGNVFNSLKDEMAGAIEIGGKKWYLSDFGINTPSYFESEDFEHSMYHIDGDPDDLATSGKEDKLKTLIATDPDTVVSFFSGLAAKLYDKMNELSATSSYSSFGSFYDDKTVKSDLSSFESKIADAQQKLTEYEDKYYAKFAAMEKALAKLNSSSSYLSGLFGGQ